MRWRDGVRVCGIRWVRREVSALQMVALWKAQRGG